MSRHLRILFAFCLLNACIAAQLNWAKGVENRQTPQQELAILRQRLKLLRDAWSNWVCAQRQKNPKLAERDDTSAGVKMQVVLPTVDFDQLALEKCFIALTAARWSKPRRLLPMP